MQRRATLSHCRAAVISEHWRNRWLEMKNYQRRFFFFPPISPSQILMNLLLFSKCAAFIYNNNSTQHSLSRAMFSGTVSHYLLLLGSSVLNSRPPATWRGFSNHLWRTLLGLNWNVFVQNIVDRLFTSSILDKSTTLVSYWLHDSGFPKNIKCYLQTKHAAKAH